MLSSIDYQALRDFGGLPCIRQACASGDIGLNIQNIPSLAQDVLRQLQAVPVVSYKNHPVDEFNAFL